LKIVLFFTFDISLSNWAKSGLLDREIILYKNLIKKGAEVIFITYGGLEDYEYQTNLGGIKIIPFYSIVKKPKSIIMAYVYSLFIPFYLRKELKDVDILKTNQMWGSWSALIAKFLFKKPLIVRCGFEKYYNLTHNSFGGIRETAWQIIAWPISFLAYYLSDSIILTSYLAKRFVIKTFGIDSNKINVSYNYIDLNVFKPIKIDKYVDRILFIGRLNKAKNLFSLLDAISSTKYHLDIIGDGELKKELDIYRSDKNISVKFLGKFNNSEIPKIINKYPVFILVSYYEGNPKALLEAMACAIGVICSDIAAISEIIKHGENGLLCKNDDKSIAKTITKLMENTKLQKKLGTSAMKFIYENCQLNQIIDNELIIYRHLINKR
jgi:glycosyltransferase involved in cell wall biosynthesis